MSSKEEQGSYRTINTQAITLEFCRVIKATTLSVKKTQTAKVNKELSNFHPFQLCHLAALLWLLQRRQNSNPSSPSRRGQGVLALCEILYLSYLI